MAFTHQGTYWVTGIEKPPLFTEEMSKVYGVEKKPFWRQII